MPGAPADPIRRRVLLAGLGAVAFASVAPACSSDSAESDGGSEGDDASSRPSDSIPQPSGFVRSNWSQDPSALGAYSFLPVGATPERRDALAAPVAGVLFFAGEATWRANPSTVHGAQASGAAAAEAVSRTATDRLDVVVIGAGVAGARAAADLDAAGHRVIVVESQATVGGRTRTVRPEGWPVPIELGASWVHDIDASDLADQLDASTVEFDYRSAVLATDGERLPGTATDAGAATAVDDALAWAEEQPGDRSLAQAIEQSGSARGVDPALLAHFLRTEVSTEYGADADELSAWWGDEGTEGDDLLVTGGYVTLAEHDLRPIDVRYGWTAATVAIEDDAVAVTSASGEVLRADRVVVTVPLGVLQAGTIAFTPALPAATQAAIDGLGVALLDKVWLRWDEPWWNEEAEQWTLVADDEPYGEWFNLQGATGEPVLLGLIGGQAARDQAGRSDDDVLASCLRALQRFADASW
ncbi:MAG: FAD-dependent oxidoreductase [Acidimicrobiales bacterium]|nr:FAD-dependent oxidoreductase [Acidimicrobiales bacterium]HRW36128.1 FAD-dependent oxidoreductase [Aquihabitans sp.]